MGTLLHDVTLLWGKRYILPKLMFKLLLRFYCLECILTIIRIFVIISNPFYFGTQFFTLSSQFIYSQKHGAKIKNGTHPLPKIVR